MRRPDLDPVFQTALCYSRDADGSKDGDLTHISSEPRTAGSSTGPATRCGRWAYGGWLNVISEETVTCLDCLAWYVAQHLRQCSPDDEDHGNEPCPDCVPEPPDDINF